MLNNYRIGALLIAVISVLSGSVLRYADEDAGTGGGVATAAEIDHSASEPSGDSGDETNAQQTETAGQVSEDSTDETNASGGDSGERQLVDGDPA